MAKEAQVEAQAATSEMAPPEMADQAEAPADSLAATAPQAALRAESAPATEAAAETDNSALAAKSLTEQAGAAPQPAMAESQAALERGSGPAGEEAAALPGTPTADNAAVLEESSPSLPTVEVPEGPEDTVQNLATEAETPEENLSFAAEEYSAPSSPTWWKALETMLAALTLAFLGGLFFRWRRNRSQSDA